MSIDNIERDLDRILDFYLYNVKNERLIIEREEYLGLWLKARNYSNEEKAFIFFLVRMRLIKILNSDAQQSGAPEYLIEDFHDHPDETFILVELFQDLERAFKIDPNEDEWASENTLDDIKEEMLLNPLRKPLFQLAEKWITHNGFLSVDGTWVKLKKGRLGTLLNILIDYKILIDDRRTIEDYFCERYSSEHLGDQMKWSKAKVYKDDFLGLILELTKKEISPK